MEVEKKSAKRGEKTDEEKVDEDENMRTINRQLAALQKVAINMNEQMQAEDAELDMAQQRVQLLLGRIERTLYKMQRISKGKFQMFFWLMGVFLFFVICYYLLLR